MKSYYQKIIECFDNKVKNAARNMYDLNLVNEVHKDFSRKRKLDFETLVKVIVFSSGKPIREELYDYFNYSADTATSSAFVQQRAKLKPEAFDYVMKEVNKKYPCKQSYKGYRSKGIFIADRNYSTWNNMEHIIKAGQFFLIQSQDIHSKSSSLRKFNLPNKEFDLDVETVLTTKQSLAKKYPDKYRFLSSTSTFDFIDKNNPYYSVKYRVVRFRIDGAEEYESIITNLNRELFPASVIKKLYNLCMIMIEEAVKHGLKRRKYVYTINITRAIHIFRDLAKRKGGIPPDLEKLLLNELLPIRPDRLDPRKVKHQSVVCFNYRFS